MFTFNDNPRILITRLSALGDCVLGMPVLCALRRRFPQAHIAWVTQPLQAEVLLGHPDLDQVLVVEKDWLRSPKQLFKLRQQLQEIQFDISLDVQGLTKSAVASWISAAPLRISFTRGQSRELAPYLANHHVVPSKRYIAERYLELLKPLGIESETLEYNWQIDPVAALHIKHFLEAQQLTHSSYAILNPGAGWFSKTWANDRFALVADYLWNMYKIKCIVTWGTQQEKNWAQEIFELAHGSALLAPKLSITQLKELIRGASLFVGNDTGPLHIAVAVGTATVAMFGVTQGEVYSPNNAKHRIVQARYEPLGSRERRQANNKIMLLNTVDMVTDQIDRVMDQLYYHKKSA